MVSADSIGGCIKLQPESRINKLEASRRFIAAIS
ncbi:Uncharacterised protein [Vibrio cholerae]|nr:Uncharacterised protein [Vibrio cholerae]